MMRLGLIFFIYVLCGCFISSAQVNNNGATIRMMKGGFVLSSGNFINTSGTLTNDGKLEVTGNFINQATYNSSTNTDSLLLTGAGSATLNTGQAPLSFLQVNKTNGSGVTLASTTTINSAFDLAVGFLSTDPLTSHELVASTSVNFKFGTGTEINGKVRRTNWINDSVITFHQQNMTVKTYGGTPPSHLMVNMVPGGDPALSEKEVKRYFYFTPVSGSNYMVDITFPYKDAELNTNNESNLAPYYFSRSLNKWTGRYPGLTTNTTLNYIISKGHRAEHFANTEWKLAEVEFNKDNNNLFVYPVPAKTNLTIVLITDQNNKATIKLFDAAGKLCKLLQKDVSRGINNLNINVTDLSPGTYVLRIEEINHVQTRSIIIL